MLKVKLQYFGHLMWRVDSLEESDAGRDWGQEEKGMREDEMAGWHHRLAGRQFEWTPGDGDGQGGLACCDSWGRKESDTTERLNWTECSNNVLSLSLGTSTIDLFNGNFFYTKDTQSLSTHWHMDFFSLQITVHNSWVGFNILPLILKSCVKACTG